MAAHRPPRPQVTATVGGKPPSGLGADALLDFTMGVSLDGEPLTSGEIEQPLAAANGLDLVRGCRVEIDPERLRRVLDEFRAVETAAAKDGLSFGEAMRLLAGAHVTGGVDAAVSPDWSQVVAGPWLGKTLAGLRDPAQLARLDPGDSLKVTLRPYQQVGVRWLHLLSSLASAPASPLANWAAEIERFAPTLTAIVAHPSAMSSADLKALDPERIAEADLVITSYGRGSAYRRSWPHHGGSQFSTKRRRSKRRAPSRRVPPSSSMPGHVSRSAARRWRRG